jgi:phage terminase small subunit
MPAAPKKARPLTPKQRRFVAEYLKDLNGRKAATRAGYSARNAVQQASRLLSKANVKAKAAAGEAEQLKGNALTASRVLEELRRLGFADIGEIYDARGQLLSFRAMTPEARATIAGVETMKKNLTAGDGQQEDVVKVKLWDKTKALDMLARHFALLKDVIQFEATDELLARLDRGRLRTAKPVLTIEAAKEHPNGEAHHRSAGQDRGHAAHHEPAPARR